MDWLEIKKLIEEAAGSAKRIKDHKKLPNNIYDADLETLLYILSVINSSGSDLVPYVYDSDEKSPFDYLHSDLADCLWDSVTEEDLCYSLAQAIVYHIQINHKG